MAKKKISQIGVGGYIRNPKGRYGVDSQNSNIEVLKVAQNQGGSFICYPVTDPKTVPPTLDMTRYQFIPKDQVVTEASL